MTVGSVSTKSVRWCLEGLSFCTFLEIHKLLNSLCFLCLQELTGLFEEVKKSIQFNPGAERLCSVFMGQADVALQLFKVTFRNEQESGLCAEMP